MVSEYESGQHSALELSRLHNLSLKVVYNWIYKYSNYNKQKIRVVEMSESSTKKVKDLEQKIKELEGIVGRKQIEIDYLSKMIEIASEDLGVDIKKNINTPRSVISEKTEKK